MNLKTILSLTTLSAATAACAVTTDNTLCRIEVNSSEAQTIIAVPLVEVATGAAIPVTDIVLTTNLSEGDTLLHKNGDVWEAWAVVEGKWAAVTVSDAGSTSKTREAEKVALTCGDAIWVNRQSTTAPFYVYGQVPANTTKPEIPTTSGVMKLMGNTQLKEAAVSEIISGSPKAGDRVVWVNSANVMGRTELEYKDGAWGMYVSTKKTLNNGFDVISTEWTTDTKVIPKIPAGQGFWYVSSKELQ